MTPTTAELLSDKELARLKGEAEAQRRAHPDKIGLSENLRGPWPCVCSDCSRANRVLQLIAEVAALRAQPSSPAEGPRWEPIETAPKEEQFRTAFASGRSFHCHGPRLLVWPSFSGVTVARWWWVSDAPERCNWLDGGGNVVHPTYWQPLPAPPASAEAEKE